MAIGDIILKSVKGKTSKETTTIAALLLALTLPKILNFDGKECYANPALSYDETIVNQCIYQVDNSRAIYIESIFIFITVILNIFKLIDEQLSSYLDQRVSSLNLKSYLEGKSKAAGQIDPEKKSKKEFQVLITKRLGALIDFIISTIEFLLIVYTLYTVFDLKADLPLNLLAILIDPYHVEKYTLDLPNAFTYRTTHCIVEFPLISLKNDKHIFSDQNSVPVVCIYSAKFSAMVGIAVVLVSLWITFFQYYIAVARSFSKKSVE